jgi:carboxyl-terminal processing protease
LGNGGISPDIKVNVNNKNIPDFFFKLLEQSTIYQFAFTYSDNHRNEFRKFKTWKELDNYLISSSLYNDFIQYCEKQGFKPNEEDKIKAKNIIFNHLRAI